MGIAIYPGGLVPRVLYPKMGEAEQVLASVCRDPVITTVMVAKTADGVIPLAPAVVPHHRVALVRVVVTEALDFAAVNGDAPLRFEVGVDTVPARGLAMLNPTIRAAVGSMFVGAFFVSAGQYVFLTAIPAVGTGTGALAVTTIVFPNGTWETAP